MRFNDDILHSIIQFDPSYKYKRVSKQFNYICQRLDTYMKVWNLVFDYDEKALDYIDKNILYMQKWGSDFDINWYKIIMRRPIFDEEQENIIDLEYNMSSCDPFIFEEFYQNNIGNIDMDKLFFFIGIRNNVQLLSYLAEKGEKMREGLYVGAITNNNVGVLQLSQAYTGNRDDITLMLATTIESYSNPEIREVIDNLNIRGAIFPIVIYPDLHHIQNINYIKGLIALKKEIKDLNFNNINVKIYFQNIEPFRLQHKENIELLVQNRYYNHLFLVAIINSCLKYGFTDILDKLWDIEFGYFPDDIVGFILKHHTYICLKSIKWIENCYDISEEDYTKIFKNPDNRDLNTAIYCLKNIRQLI